MTRPRIESRSPGALMNTLPTRPMTWYNYWYLAGGLDFIIFHLVIFVAMTINGCCDYYFIILFLSYLPTPPLGQNMTQGQFLSGVLRFWIQSFPSPRLVASPRLPYYLPIAGGRIIGCIPFPRVLVLCEMQSVSSKIWTRVAVSISCDDNHYTIGSSYSFFIVLESWNCCDYAIKNAGESFFLFFSWHIYMIPRV